METIFDKMEAALKVAEKSAEKQLRGVEPWQAPYERAPKIQQHVSMALRRQGYRIIGLRIDDMRDALREAGVLYIRWGRYGDFVVPEKDYPKALKALIALFSKWKACLEGKLMAVEEASQKEIKG